MSRRTRVRKQFDRVNRAFDELPTLSNSGGYVRVPGYQPYAGLDPVACIREQLKCFVPHEKPSAAKEFRAAWTYFCLGIRTLLGLRR
jgi:hypothetical protein